MLLKPPPKFPSCSSSDQAEETEPGDKSAPKKKAKTLAEMN